MVEDHFPADIAARYDAACAAMLEPSQVDPAVALLIELAAGGPCLELGIGTGRIALPLSAAGIAVHGVDLSTSMVERLREKPGAERLTITIGDFARVEVAGRYTLAYLVFNTIMNLTAQDEQVACFENAARHLRPGGRFAVEVMIPDLQRLPPGETYQPFAVEKDRLGLNQYDVSTQKLVSHHFRLESGQASVRSVPFLYVWPSKLDLMARLAGLKLEARWSNWDRTPFTSESRKHISIWRKAD